jgi:hypothetical protein
VIERQRCDFDAVVVGGKRQKLFKRIAIGFDGIRADAFDLG